MRTPLRCWLAALLPWVVLMLYVSGTATAARAPVVHLGRGAWSWFGDPRAVHYEGKRKATYVAWVTPSGRQMVASWDGRERVRTDLPGYFPPDDHSAPSLTVLRDGRLMLFSSNHNGNQMDTRISSGPEDVSDWSATRPVGTNTPGKRGYTYPNVVRPRGRAGPLYLFWRGGDWLPAYSRYLGNRRWSPARRFVKVARNIDLFSRPYVKYATNGKGALAVAFSHGHPRNGDGGIRFAFFRRGWFSGAAGRRIGGVPLDARRSDVVRPSGGAWIQDVAVSRSGRPVVVYATFPSPRRQHVYYYATFSHGRWRRHRIASGGGPIGAVNRRVHGVLSREVYYSGGMALDHARPSVVYLSREVAGVHRIERWRTPDRGRRWRHRAVTGTARESMRPVVPLGSLAGQRDVLWMSGLYIHYHHFSTTIDVSSPFGQPPTASFKVSSVSDSGKAVAFNPAKSHAGTSPLIGSRWDFGDGSPAVAANAGGGRAVHKYAAPGRYFPRLVLTDATGRSDTYVRELSITSGSGRG